ncbi:crossover junction endodeoxyribonuclease RuvC [Neolewinella antarctica]|uniref:Crossover junction endodeoxyribonuclease RuvC n=1 Tax=Neolewinella antarctica TaxID=442734 RepID=A0ABX0XGJ9_9BACT|nr:crossover junction endodeoxyribonuclease RuvC [Neolewinella antarctica]NJC27903.1 crossover junction endodeoxyribonuclease RuvC [Neolewinella antarctica]
MPAPKPKKKADAAPYRIIGIDPGTVVLGFAVVEIHPRSKRILELGTLKLAQFKDHAERLSTIHRRLTQVIGTHKPSVMAIESPFFGKNPQSMLKLGRAQGVCMAAAMNLDVKVVEYAPRKIKQAVAGNGNASKEQVCKMLEQEFSLDMSRVLNDATDALGAAMCHYYQTRGKLGGGTSFKGWEGFLAANARRIKK